MTFSTRHNLELLLAGDISADTQSDKIDQQMNSSERTTRLVQGAKCHQRRTTYFCVSQRGNVIDLFITSESITEFTNFIMVDHETELFTGAPTRGHLHLWLNMKGEDTKENKPKKKTSRTLIGNNSTSV